jgi:hypothetical protein
MVVRLADVAGKTLAQTHAGAFLLSITVGHCVFSLFEEGHRKSEEKETSGIRCYIYSANYSLVHNFSDSAVPLLVMAPKWKVGFYKREAAAPRSIFWFGRRHARLRGLEFQLCSAHL